jgi:hypothetical protein
MLQISLQGRLVKRSIEKELKASEVDNKKAPHPVFQARKNIGSEKAFSARAL